MKVKIIMTMEVDTEKQDKYLKESLERLAWNKEQSYDRTMVLKTFTSRMGFDNLKVELL